MRRRDVDASKPEIDVMHNMKWMRVGLCAGLLLSAPFSFADGSSAPVTPTADAPSDQGFLARALSVNQLELVLGQMAAGHGNTPEVRVMGEKMVQKHTEFGRQLGELAHRPAAAGVPELSGDQRRTFARLAALSGSDFDRSFKETVDAGHVQELAMYRDEVSHAADPRLRALARGRVATLEQTVAKAAQAMNAKPKNEDW
jgi:predicted outer membrane protein